jgi:hypothetical protein
MDFDKAVDYWVRARAAGTLVAWDNIRTHYETGMNGAREDGIDVDKMWTRLCTIIERVQSDIAQNVN